MLGHERPDPPATTDAAPQANWAGSYRYGFTTVLRPTDDEELAAGVAEHDHLRVIGSRHSFNGAPDGEVAVSLAAMPARCELAPDRTTVTVSAGTTYAELAQRLDPHGLAVDNLASLPHISVGGAVATATHGSGSALGNLATSVCGLELVTSDGTTTELRDGDPDFRGAVVGLGALGVVRALTLRVRPAFEIRQTVYDDLAWEPLLDDFDAVMGAGRSVSVFTTWGDRAGALWVKAAAEDGDPPAQRFGAPAATGPHHPIPGLDARHCSEQFGVAGPWWDRLPHFRAGFVPSNGAEIQSEFLVDRQDAAGALHALRGIGERLRPALQVAEVRTIAADDLWLSPQFERPSMGLHFTWHRDPAAVAEAVAAVEEALAPFDPRPHWGKWFTETGPPVADRYPRADDFRALRARLDPSGTFRNAWLRRVLG